MPRHGCAGYREIAAQLRREWLSRWQPGQRLPPHVELAERFQTTPVTLQRAMDLLAEQGFIVTRPAVGSFLADLPPERCRIGLVFPGHPEEIPHSWLWSRHYLANLRAAERFNLSQSRWRIHFYMDVSPEAGSQGLARLRRDLDDRVLAGLIFSYSPHDLMDRGLLEAPVVPIVYRNPDFQRPGMGVRLGAEDFFIAATAWAQRRGRRRPAVVTTPMSEPDVLLAQLSAAGLEARREWVQAASPFHPQWLPHLVAGLFASATQPRPDVLLITDDHLVEPVVDALLDLPEAARRDLAILGHWNYPLPYRGHLPIERFGPDAREWLAMVVDLIARHPEPPCGKGEVGHLPWRFASELEPDSPALPESWIPITEALHQAKETLQCTLA